MEGKLALNSKQAARRGASATAPGEGRLTAFPCCCPPSHLPRAAPNHIKAIWKVFVSESWLCKKLFKLEIGFTVSWAWGEGMLAANHAVRAASASQALEAASIQGPCIWHCAMQVTKKKVAGEEEAESHWEEFKRALSVTWPHLLYYVALAAGTVYFIVRAALGSFK